MSLVWIGLAIVAIGALLGLFQQKWTLPAVFGVVIGFGLAGYGFFSSQSQPQVIEETVLASDEQPAAQKEPATAPPAGGEMTSAPDIPEHVIKGEAKPWVAAVKKVLDDPKAYPLFNSGVAESGINKGDKFYEYANLELGGRKLRVIFVSRSPTDPNVWMMHIEPADGEPPIEAQELGSVAVVGQGDGFIIYEIKDGPFAGDYLVWSTDDQGQGGYIIRIYTPAYLEREHARNQQAQNQG
ncbi:hypothetical protein [Oceanithermus sp.]